MLASSMTQTTMATTTILNGNCQAVTMIMVTMVAATTEMIAAWDTSTIVHWKMNCLLTCKRYVNGRKGDDSSTTIERQHKCDENNWVHSSTSVWNYLGNDTKRHHTLNRDIHVSHTCQSHHYDSPHLPYEYSARINSIVFYRVIIHSIWSLHLSINISVVYITTTSKTKNTPCTSIEHMYSLCIGTQPTTRIQRTPFVFEFVNVWILNRYHISE